MSEAPADADRGYPSHRGFDAATFKWVSALVAGLGLWLAVSPIVYGASEPMTALDVVVGTGIFLVAGYEVVRMLDGGVAGIGSAVLVVLFGQWAVLAPFVFPFEPLPLVASNVAVGLLAAALAAYSAYELRRTRTTIGPDAWT